MGGEARILVSREAGRESQILQGGGCDCCPSGVGTRLCKTNPISWARSGRRGTGYRSYKTNPILKAMGRRVARDAGIRPAVRKRDAFDTPWFIVQNKANARLARELTPAQKRGYERNAGRVKQSQFPGTEPGHRCAEQESCKTKPISVAIGRRRMVRVAGILPAMRRQDAFDTGWPVVRNKANFRSRMLCRALHCRAWQGGCWQPGGSVKAEGLGDGPVPGKVAIAKLRVTMPPTVLGEFAFTLARREAS